MALKLPDLGSHRVVIQLPDLDATELVPSCEVLCQEGFRVWTVSGSQVPELPGLLRLFRRRAQIGVHRVTTRDEIAAASASGATFAMSDFLLPDLVATVSDLPVVLGGMTPSELRAGLAAGAAAVQLVPSEAIGADYARVLPGLLAPHPVLAGGRLERHRAQLWLDSGGAGVCPHDLLTPADALGESLDYLRTTLQRWRLGDPS